MKTIIAAETLVIGSSTSWTIQACKNGHAMRVQCDDLLDEMLLTDMTLGEFGHRAAERALSQECEVCAEKGGRAMRTKPIRIFWSPLSRRLYASRAYKESGPGIVTITGERFDVTNDIAALIEKHGITFDRAEKREEA